MSLSGTEQVQPRRLLGREARREAILSAAADAFAARGYSATSMEDVAAAARITRLIVYRHFESKQVLYESVLERVADSLRRRFTAEMGPGHLAEGAVRSMLGAARENPSGFELLWRHAAREQEFRGYADTVRARMVSGAEGLLERFPAGALPRRWAAASLVAYLIEAVLAWMDEGSPGGDEVFSARLARSIPALVRAWSEPA